MAPKWQEAIPENFSLKGIKNSIHVDLGCGNLPRNPLSAEKIIGVDVSPEAPYKAQSGFLEYIQVQPGATLPFESNQINSVSAFDFLEHIPRSDRTLAGAFFNPFIEIMNEIHRILKPGGVFVALTPCYPSPAAFTDPTHVNFISDTTHLYFSGPNFANTKKYGFIGNFELVEASWSDWRGVLWDSFAIEPQDIKEKSRENQIVSREIQYRNLKTRIRRELFGYGGETHFLWVLQKK
jgi:SAM-dependent methyltransferase